MLAASQGATQLKKRGFKVRLMMWCATSVGPEEAVAAGAVAIVAEEPIPGLAGRGLHSFTSQLNLSRICH